MKQTLIFFELLFIGLNCFSQEYLSRSYFTVLSQTGLNMRAQPDPNSPVVTTIPFGTEIDADFSKEVSDRINGFAGVWYPVSYKGYTGYVWSQYLGSITIPKQGIINNDYRLIEEGAHCGELNYMPDLHWYGIFETNKPGIQELKKVRINLIIKSTLNEEERRLIFEESFGNADFLIKTDSDRKSVFLIGSKEPLDEMQFNAKGAGNIGFSGFLFPEQKESFFIPGYEELELKAKEVNYIIDSSNCALERKYELELSNFSQGVNLKQAQNLTTQIPAMKFSASKHASFLSPKIIWWGDIDHDRKFDLLIYSDQMRESGDNLGFLILFLSSGAEKDQIVRKVAEWVFKSSCEG